MDENKDRVYHAKGVELMEAIRYDDFAAVKTALDSGADVDYVYQPGSDGLEHNGAALHYAAGGALEQILLTSY